VGFFSLIAWIVFVFADGRRRREQLKVLSEFHSKILEKLGSAAEFDAHSERVEGTVSTYTELDRLGAGR